MLNDAKDLNKFRRIRANYKKKSVSGTVVKARFEHIALTLEGKFTAFGYLNETEKMDFMLIMMESLMTVSGWFPEMKTIEQLEADENAKKYFEKHGKPMPDIALAENVAG